jgi:undecaprenyl diphosphate synthase
MRSTKPSRARKKRSWRSRALIAETLPSCNRFSLSMNEKEHKAIEHRILKKGNLPSHVAIIMDGNGRWARKRGLPRVAGHRAGIKAVREVVKGCGSLHIDYLTLYTFSVENWKRPAREINALMRFLRETLRREVEELDRNNVRLRAIGRLEDLPREVRVQLARAIDSLNDNTGLTLVLALSYAGRAEILDAVRRIAEGLSQGKLRPEDLDDHLFTTYLYTGSMPDPDLLIRTSGEMRISNFLLWQIAYSELWITNTLWPDFRRKHLYEAIMDYQERERRFGRVSARRKATP